jgi:hypothetical protein
MCASIARSAIWFLVHNDESMFRLPSDDAIQEVSPLTVVPLQKPGAHVLAVMLMFFSHIFGHPPCGNLAETKKVMQ